MSKTDDKASQGDRCPECEDWQQSLEAIALDLPAPIYHYHRALILEEIAALRRQLHASQQAVAQEKEGRESFRAKIGTVQSLAQRSAKEAREKRDELGERCNRSKVAVLNEVLEILFDPEDSSTTRDYEIEDLHRELAQAEEVIEGMLNIICAPDDGLYDQLATRDTRLKKVLVAAKALREQLAQVGEERDRFEDQIVEWQTASSLIVGAEEDGGDPDGVTPAMLEKSRNEDSAEIERLRGLLPEAFAEGMMEGGQEYTYSDAQTDEAWEESSTREAAKLARGGAAKEEEKSDG